MTSEHAKQRLAFALRHQNWVEEWKYVIFSDECSVERSARKRSEWVYRTPQQKWQKDMYTTDKRTGYDIRQMFWAAIWWDGRSELIDMKRDVTSKRHGYTAWSVL